MIPAHKNVKNPPGQIVNQLTPGFDRHQYLWKAPISPAKRLGDIIDAVVARSSEPALKQPQAERERINLLLAAIREHWVKSNGEESITVAALDQIAAVIADGSYVATPTPKEPT